MANTRRTFILRNVSRKGFREIAAKINEQDGTCDIVLENGRKIGTVSRCIISRKLIKCEAIFTGNFNGDTDREWLRYGAIVMINGRDHWLSDDSEILTREKYMLHMRRLRDQRRAA